MTGANRQNLAHGSISGLIEPASHLLDLAHADKVGLGHVGVGHGVVRVGVEHDDRKCQQVGAVSGSENARVGSTEALRKLLHDAINLLRLACSNRDNHSTEPCEWTGRVDVH